MNRGIDIGPLVEQDMEALALLYRQFWGEGSAVEKMRATFRRLQADDHYLFLAARHEGRLVGSVTGIVCEELCGECRPFLLIEDLVVDEARRRMGIGATLMRARASRSRPRLRPYPLRHGGRARQGGTVLPFPRLRVRPVPGFQEAIGQQVKATVPA